MEHRRFASYAALASTSALLLGAGIMDIDTRAPSTDAAEAVTRPEPIGDAEEAATDSNENKTTNLPYEPGFDIREWVNTQRFVLAGPASITVSASARWGGPSVCRGSQYTITMMGADGRNEGSKSYLIGGAHPDVQSFQNVPPGRHYLRVEVRNPDEKQCRLRGTLTIFRT